MSADIKTAAIGRSLLVLGVLLALSIFLMLGGLVYVADKRADLQKHMELSAEQLLISQRMATFSLGASSGNENDFSSLMKGRIRFDSVLATFRDGAAEAPPLVAEVLPALRNVEESWLTYKKDIEIILGGKQPISEVRELYQVIDSFIPQMLTYSDEVVGVLMKKNASQRQIYLASRQMMLSQRIKNNLNQVLAGGETAAAAADRFGRDAALFGRVLEGLLKGSKSLRIDKTKKVLPSCAKSPC